MWSYDCSASSAVFPERRVLSIVTPWAADDQKAQVLRARRSAARSD